MFEGSRGLVGQLAPNLEHPLTLGRRGKHADNELAGIAVGPVFPSQHAPANEGVVVALGPIGGEGRVHGLIIVDDAVDLHAQHFDCGLGGARRHQILLLEGFQHSFRRIVSFQTVGGTDDRDLVEHLVAKSLTSQSYEESRGEVRRLHAQRLVAERLEVRALLAHVFNPVRLPGQPILSHYGRVRHAALTGSWNSRPPSG